MPEVPIRFEGYLIRETAGCLLGMPPLQTTNSHSSTAQFRSEHWHMRKLLGGKFLP